jgi:tetratricopeptide (TPR) repeat protein
MAMGTRFAVLGPVLLARANSTCTAYDRLGRFDEAVAVHEAALTRFRAVDDRGIGYSLRNLGEVCRQRGEYREAEGNLMQALALQRAEAEMDGPRYTFAHLAELCRAADRPAEARDWYDQGIESSMTAGDRWHAAKLLARLADLAPEPHRHLRAAHALFVEVGDEDSAAKVAVLLARGC